MEKKRKIILDVDTGTDDSIAIMLAVLSKKFDILGITTVWGNQPVEYTTKNTLKVLEFLNSKVKVYKGCSEAMIWPHQEERAKHFVGDVISYYDEKGKEHHLHPKNMPFPATKRKADNKHAVSFLIETLMNSKEKITLIPVGPCTNIGMAFKLEPRIKDHIEEIVFMGGSDKTGNVTPTAEANFWHDPDAVRLILKSGVKCVIGSLNATTSVPLTIDDVELLEKMNTKYSKKAAQIVRIRMDVAKHLGWSDGTSETVHDPITIAYLLDKKVAKRIERKEGDIYCGIEKEGTLLLKDNPKGNIHFIYEADKERFFNIWKELLSKY